MSEQPKTETLSEWRRRQADVLAQKIEKEYRACRISKEKRDYELSIVKQQAA